MFGLSPMHLLVIMVVLLLLFGSRLPDVARSIGRSVNEFKRGLREVNDDVEDAMKRSDDDEKRPPRQLKSADENQPRNADSFEQREKSASAQKDDVHV